MTLHVDWPATLAAAAGIIVLTGYAWVRRGHRGAAGACAAVGGWRLLAGLATGNVFSLAQGVIILAVSGWCLWYLREPASHGTGRGRQGR